MTMPRHSYFLALLLLLSPTVNSARETPELGSPAFTTVPELSAGFDLLYEQRFAEAREVFTSWESRNPDKPFGEVAIAASYLFEELDRQGVLTSDFFLDEKKRSEEHTSELQSRLHLVCRLLLEKKNIKTCHT